MLHKMPMNNFLFIGLDKITKEARRCRLQSPVLAAGCPTLLHRLQKTPPTFSTKKVQAVRLISIFFSQVQNFKTPLPRG